MYAVTEISTSVLFLWKVLSRHASLVFSKGLEMPYVCPRLVCLWLPQAHKHPVAELPQGDSQKGAWTSNQ